MKRSEALAHRIHAQQLDRAEAARAITDAAIFDFGVQDTGQTALVGRWLTAAFRCATRRSLKEAQTWRWCGRCGSASLLPADRSAAVFCMTSPLSDRDAAKRVIGADKPLKEAGIPTLAGLTEVATQMRQVVTRPLVKGDVSTQLTARLDPPYLRYCRPCKATHSWEVPFRIGALYAGLELEPGTSPPVLRRIPGWPKRTPDLRRTPWPRPSRCNPSNYLKFLGPATPTTSPRSSIRRSPRSRPTGRRTRWKSPLLAGALGYWAR